MSVASDLREDMAKTEAVSDERLAELIATTPNDPEHTITMFSDALHAIFTELLSRRAANSAGGVEVKVKPLEWEVGTSGIASTPFGEYSVQFYTESDGEGWEAVFCDAETIGQFATSNEAIAACQTDFNQRILSVLTHPSSPVSAEVTEWQTAIRLAFQTGDEPVAWMAFNKHGACELFIEEDNAVEWAEDDGYLVPLMVAFTPMTITPHMLNAGTDQITSPSMDADDKKDLAVKVFRAMIEARNSTHPSSPVSAEVTEAFKRVDGELSGYCYAEGPGDLRIRTNDQRLLDRILAALNGKE